MSELLVAGNSTMPSTVGIWNLPADITCTPSPWCREHCYARSGRFCWPNVDEAINNRYIESMKPGFAGKMIDELSRRQTINFVRIHISGDFYNKEYVRKWAMIARWFPEIIFRTNTRRQDLLPYMVDRMPLNVVIRESIDPTRRPLGITPIHAIKGTPGSEGYFVCRDNCEECEFFCWHNRDRNIVSSKIR